MTAAAIPKAGDAARRHPAMNAKTASAKGRPDQDRNHPRTTLTGGDRTQAVRGRQTGIEEVPITGLIMPKTRAIARSYLVPRQSLR